MTRRNHGSYEWRLNQMRDKLLKYFRKKVGNYCSDSYWYGTIDNILAKPEPIKFINDNLSMLAINAIGTDSNPFM